MLWFNYTIVLKNLTIKIYKGKLKLKRSEHRDKVKSQ